MMDDEDGERELNLTDKSGKGGHALCGYWVEILFLGI